MKSIRELREEHGWTQLELANKIGVTPSSVYSWERGRYEPKARQLRAIALAFGVSMDVIALPEEDSAQAKSRPELARPRPQAPRPWV